VWYGGLERLGSCFVGGSVSAREEGMIERVSGAVVVLYATDEKIAETVSDAFGDFRFGGLAKGSRISRSRWTLSFETLAFRPASVPALGVHFPQSTSGVRWTPSKWSHF
jgi:hypothetical protein